MRLKEALARGDVRIQWRGGIQLFQIPEAINSMEEGSSKQVENSGQTGSSQQLHEEFANMPLPTYGEVLGRPIHI